ncbi:LysR family transcriptional regulator [Shewanella mangrovi]|uniref:LysR family transcriptional regulator n=1 Tax=Shewanella mangrovi TaxID=1515746 RepID=A0A094LTJ2_9GAMM|nr:LysR family transcriptional regulator [Shewanella mangrovi]KFZ38523.1 LysR family transcriptional regulator [Shewanella mangrovi]
MNPWNGLPEFIAVAELQSFTAAAARLGISSAQVSRQIAALERRLNSKLFYRTTRKVSLTNEGQLYYRHCRTLQDGIEEAERALGSLQREPQGQLRVTAPVTYGEQFLVPLFNDFQLQFPKLTIEIVLTNKTLDLIENGIDLAVRLGKLDDSSFIAKRLASRRNYVCAAPSYLAHYGAPHTLSELTQHNCLVGNTPYWRMSENGAEKQIKVSGNYVCNSGMGVLDAVRKGLGLALLPDYYVAQELAQGKLVEVLSQYRGPSEGVWGLYPHNRHLSPKVSMLLTHLEKGLKHKRLQVLE